MTKVSIQVGKRVTIDEDYEEYKQWEGILADMAEEHTHTSEKGYWKSLNFTIGNTRYRITGPTMPKKDFDTEEADFKGIKGATVKVRKVRKP